MPRTQALLRYRPDGRTLSAAPALRPPERAGSFPSLSVVLALHGQRRLTAACLSTLQTDVPDAEVICVDNASPDDTREWLAGQPVKALLFSENRGCAGAWNAGLEVARGAVLCVLNNDTLVRSGGLRKLAQAAWEQGIAAQTGGVLNARLEFVRSTLDPTEADYPEGYALAFRRDVWQAVGPFDQGMKLGYCEDTDWGLRARSRGFRFACVPGAVDHLGARTAATVPGLAAVRERNGARLRRRWAGQGVGERLLVRRWGALGDVLMTTPTLAALKAAAPLARLYLETAPASADLLGDLPELDGAGSGPLWRATRRIDLDGAYEDLHQAGEWRHPVLAYAAAAGVALTDYQYRLPALPDLEAWAAALLPEPPETLVACGLRSVFRPKQNWREAGWLALARAAPARTFVLFDPEALPKLEVRGRPPRGKRLYDAPNVRDLTGETPSARHLVALLRRCGACVTVDTGILHLAAAVGLPTVLLAASAPGWGIAPLTGRLLVLQGEADCYPCTYPTRCAREDGRHCLDWVTGERVAAALGRVVGV